MGCSTGGFAVTHSQRNAWTQRGHSSSLPIGMVLVARLAADQSVQGRGVGATLLAEALRKAVGAGEVAAARLIVVDAVDEESGRLLSAVRLHPAPEYPLRLYRRVKDLRASLNYPADE
jgi:GNAT superfamily N-acetyltransferase